MRRDADSDRINVLAHWVGEAHALLTRDRATDGCAGEVEALRQAGSAAIQARAALRSAQRRLANAQADSADEAAAIDSDQDKLRDLNAARRGDQLRVDQFTQKVDAASSALSTATSDVASANQALQTCLAQGTLNQCASEQDALTSAQGKEQAAQSDLAQAQTDLSNAQQNLAQTEDDIHNTQSDIDQHQHAKNAADQAADQDQDTVDKAQADYDQAERDLEQAKADLKECRKHHKAHVCGERGGPGFRRPDGKCAGWDDWD